MRGVGVAEAFGGLSDAVVVLFAVLTQLGDAWFLFGFVTLLYWRPPRSLRERLGGRRPLALLVALAVGALTLTVTLKAAFALPRPPGAGTAVPPSWAPVAVHDVYASVATGTGFGFPSGHALGVTIVYGGAALLLPVGARRHRAVAVAAVVGLVSLSRLVLGVHYLADVAVGVGVGLAYLFAVRRVADRPDLVFGAGAAVAAVGLAVALSLDFSASAHEATAAFGGNLGGLLAWRRAGATTDASALSVPVVAVGLAVAGGLSGGTYVLSESLALTGAVAAVVVGLVVALPRLVGRTRKKRNGSVAVDR